MAKKLLSSHLYIQLPSDSTTDPKLLPSSIGSYRLKQGVSKRGVTVIEIWREEAGKAIPRPPEGWDDLDVGGAERHGRWAWGDESPSEIENAVAARIPFFEDIEAINLIQILTKMLLLLVVSWFVTSVVMCAMINIPLINGRFALYLLRVPESRVHDPLAFIIGILLLVPVVGTIAKLLASSNDGVRGVFYLLLNWVKSFKPHHSHEKMKTLSTFCVLWLVIFPVQLGFLYSSFFVGIKPSSDWHAWDVILFWGTGTLIFNSWAIMCHYSVFTKKFWTDIVLGDDQGGGNQNQNDLNVERGMNNAEDINADEMRKCTWQGKDGAIAHAFESIIAFILRWEWDKVDKQSLLQDCAVPLSKHFMISCIVPMVMLSLAAALPLSSVIERQFGLTAMFRVTFLVSIIVDFVHSSKHSLQCWFQAAHRIARDDQYLIGEILLNYSPIL